MDEWVAGWFLFGEIGLGRCEKGVSCWIWRRSDGSCKGQVCLDMY